MKYDDASWHSGGEFPADLPPAAGATHSGMFLAWALISGLGGEYHVIDSVDDLAQLRARKITPGQYFLVVCDGKFTDEDLSAEGNDFAQAYFDLEKGNFLGDYREFLVKGLASDYHVPDSWRSFDKLRPVLDRRLANWRRGRIASHEDPWPEAPPAEPSPPVVPAAEPTVARTPTVEIPRLEIPPVEAPPAEVPRVEATVAECPAAESPPIREPTVEIPRLELSQVEEPPVVPPPPPAPAAVKVKSADDLPEDILQKITDDFGSEITPGVLSRLAGFIGQLADGYGEAPDARVLRCVVHLAAGDRKQLEDACRLALTDTRDVIYRAEYDKSERQVRDFTLPFEA